MNHIKMLKIRKFQRTYLRFRGWCAGSATRHYRSRGCSCKTIRANGKKDLALFNII